MKKIAVKFTPTALLLYKATRDIFHSNGNSKTFYIFFIGLPILMAISMTIIGFFADKNIDLVFSVWEVLGFAFLYAFVLMPIIQYYAARKAISSNLSATSSSSAARQ